MAALLCAALAGCASAPHQSSAASSAEKPEPSDLANSQMSEFRAMMASINSRLDSIETRMGSLNDKVINTQSNVEALMANRKPVPSAVAAHPSEGAGNEPPNTLAANDPEAGFVVDSAIQDYRKASILLQAQKYGDAAQAFSAFVDKYPDHVLAGSAQYGIGVAYLKQRDFKMALHEFEKVLTSYDRSPHVSDTLRDMAEAEDALNLREQAARHRQLLSSLFAQSPAAVANASPGTDAKGMDGKSMDGKGAKDKGALAMPHLDEPPPSIPTTAAMSAPTAPIAAPTASEGHEAKEGR